MPNEESKKYDVAIIGAGPAGALAAKLLRDSKLSVAIVEAANFPRFSIGESLLPNSLNILENAAMLEDVELAGFQFKNGAVFERATEKRSIDFRENYDSGWGTALQVQRATFDQILANSAEKAGADIFYNQRVTEADLKLENCQLVCQDQNGKPTTIRSRFVLDASGYGRVLSKLLKLETPSDLSDKSVLFTHVKDNINTDLFDRNKILISVHPTQQTLWYWLIPFSDGTSSVGVVYDQQDVKQDELNGEDLFNKLLADVPAGEILKDAERIRPISNIQGYSCNVRQLYGDGYALLGNAAEFLDPIFSSGVTIAFKSAEMAVPQVIKQLAGQPHDWEGEFAQPLKAGVDVFREFVNFWYAGRLQNVVLRYPDTSNDLTRMMISILSGYVWNKENLLVKNPKRYLNLLEELCA